MTTNTNPSRTTARFFASTTPNAEGLYVITDRAAKGTKAVTAYVKGRAAARAQAAILTAIDPADRVIETKATKKAKAQGKAAKAKPAAKAEPKAATRTSHADCAHASSKLARAICRREAAKAATPSDASKADA